VARFEVHPGRTDALALREWDDRAKFPDGRTDDIGAFLPVLERLTVERG